MEHAFIEELKQSLVEYEAVATLPDVDGETKDGVEMIANTVRRLIAGIESNDANRIQLESTTFSRQVSDVYFEQPVSFGRLASAIGAVRKALELNS